jgi:hypothetical protein
VSREPLKMGRFAVFVCGRKPVAAIHGLRRALGMEDFKNSDISRGGLMYTGGGRKAKTEILVKEGAMTFARFLLFTLAAVPVLFAQKAPCGRNIVVAGGKAVEDQFLPSSPQHVKESILKALPLFAAKPEKVSDLTIETTHDRGLYEMFLHEHKQAGVKGVYGGMGAAGKFEIEIKPDTVNGVAGSRVHIEFHKNKLFPSSAERATPLIEEVACLCRILSLTDPQKNPRGTRLEGEQANASREITVPKGTPVNLLLRDFVYSKNIKKIMNQPLILEVAEDVKVDGVTAIQRGALAIGKLSSAKAAGFAGKGAKLDFSMETVTAADGQSLSLISGIEGRRGQSSTAIVTNYGAAGAAAGILFSKGDETYLRAGAGYEAEISEQYTVKVGGE